MSNRLTARATRFGILRSIGVLICIFGILIGLFLSGIGGSIGDAAIQNAADFRVPLGFFVSSVGLLIFLVPTVGLIALIWARYAKGVIARISLNLIGAAAALVIAGSVSLVVGAYQGRVRQIENMNAALLSRAEQGDARSQFQIGMVSYNDCLFSDQSVPCYCPEAIHWLRQAAFQGGVEAIGKLSAAYHNCAPGDPDSNLILSQIWFNIQTDDPEGQYSLVSTERWQEFHELVPYAADGSLTTTEQLTIRAREIFADPDMSAADRQLAMDSDVRDLVPLINEN